MTPLLLASASGDLKTVRFLLDKGAIFEFNETTCQLSPLMVAALYGNEDVVRFFLDRGFNGNSIAPKTSKKELYCESL